METKDKLYYYHNDINGAPLRLTDEAGNIVWNAHYDIFGKIDKISKNEIDNPIRMQGQYEDEETGLYYNRYRYYDPNISAYVSQDPLGLGAGENVYSYTKNSFGWIDPLGLCSKKSGTTPISEEGADFYVKPNGEVVPATGYRYMASDAPYLSELNKTKFIPANDKGTYFSFDKYDVASPSKLQVPHDASVRGSFDTMQIIDDVKIPNGNWGKASYIEPITKDFPEFGSGGATQAITNKKIILDEIITLSK